MWVITQLTSLPKAYLSLTWSIKVPKGDPLIFPQVILTHNPQGLRWIFGLQLWGSKWLSHLEPQKQLNTFCGGVLPETKKWLTTQWFCQHRCMRPRSLLSTSSTFGRTRQMTPHRTSAPWARCGPVARPERRSVEGA